MQHTTEIQETIWNVLKITVQHYQNRYDGIRNDSMTLQTAKLYAVGEVLKVFRLEWNEIFKLFKTHTPVHPALIKKLLKLGGGEDVQCTLSQIFVRNEKLVRILKNLTRPETLTLLEEWMAVDGLNGVLSHGPNFELRHYIANLKVAPESESKFNFDDEPEFRRKHVRAVRILYQMLGSASDKPLHIYRVVSKCIYHATKVVLPVLVVMEHKQRELSKELESTACETYSSMMNREDIENIVKSLRIRGQKRSVAEREEDDDCVVKEEEEDE